MDVVLDDGAPSGAIAVRLSDTETAALLDVLFRDHSRLRLSDPEQAAALDAAARKLGSIVADNVAGLEVRAVRTP